MFRGIVLILLSLILSACLKESSDANPNIYKSGVWSDSGVYDVLTSRYTNSIVVTVNDRHANPVPDRMIFLEIPEGLEAVPASCISDRAGRCAFEVTSVFSSRGHIAVWAETDSIADSTTQASKKVNPPTDVDYVKLATLAPYYFTTEVTVLGATHEGTLWKIHAAASDHQGRVAGAGYAVTEEEGTAPCETGTTDATGTFTFSLPGDATGLHSCSFSFEGIMTPTSFTLDMANYPTP